MRPSTPPDASDHVVLVDDDPRMLRAASIALRAYLPDTEVHAFVDPHTAFMEIIGTRPGVVVIDYHMVSCTGAELAKALRSVLGDDCPELVLVTGDSRIPRTERRLFDGVYTKPISPFDLAEHIGAALGRRISGIRVRDVGASTGSVPPALTATRD